MPKSEFKQVASYALETEAGQFKSILEENGIPAFLDGATANTMLSYVGTALGGVRLLVRESDFDRATDILTSLADGTDSPGGDWFCGACNEDVDAGFQVCWSCGRQRSEVERPIHATESSDTEKPSATNDEPSANHLAEEDADAELVLKRAWRTSVIGFFLFPIVTHLYSMYLLIRATLRGKQFSPYGQKLFYMTLALNVFAGLIWSSLVRWAIW